jgi:hypothetical protein
MTVGLTVNHQASGDWLLRQMPPANGRPSVRFLGNDPAGLAGADTRPIAYRWQCQKYAYA